MRSNWLRPAAWLGMLGAALVSGSAQAQEPEVRHIRRVQVRAVEGDAAQGQEDVLYFVQVEPGEQAAPPAGAGGGFLLQAPEGGQALAAMMMSEYWIGLACDVGVLNATTRAQLGLPEDKGLAVTSVVPESPAAAAGFQAHDILLSAGETPLASVADLVKVVDDAKEQEITIELMRGGKTLSIKVTPAKRPEEMQPDAAAGFDFVRPWIARLPRGGRSMRMTVPQPGVLMPQGAGAFAFGHGAALPDGTTVAITKTGSEPAKIVVERGEERFEVTEDKLDELPEDLRGPVGAMVGRMPFQVQVQEVQPPLVVAPEGAPQRAQPHIIVRSLPPQPGEPAADPLAEIMKRLDELQKAVAELQAAQQAQQEPAPQP